MRSAIVFLVIISIHTSREGCDVPSIRCIWPWYRFQSTHPARDVTPVLMDGDIVIVKFQSTHPARDVTPTSCINCPISRISIHTSREGCDTILLTPSIPPYYISIHTSREGCDLFEAKRIQQRGEISIHTSREGCDCAAGMTFQGWFFRLFCAKCFLSVSMTPCPWSVIPLFTCPSRFYLTIFSAQEKSTHITMDASCFISSFLSSQAASSQVLSAFVSLTTVFGMGTGVSSQLSPLNL